MHRRWLRIATLLLPALIAADIAMRSHSSRLVTVAMPVIVGLWAILIGALAMRCSEAFYRRGAARGSAWDAADVLTTTGASVLWLGALALHATTIVGWASLSVIGVLGIGTVCVTATWTAVVAGGSDPWRGATITRTIMPALAVEGDPLREELRLNGVRIPAAMRLFAIGRAMRHGAVSRYSAGAEASRADVKLTSELGPALRGEHRAPPLSLWLGDVLGLTRTPVAQHGEVTFCVLPRPSAVDGVRQLLGAGGDDAIARPTLRLPTEGSFNIRDYAAGDDTRRIHWVRSLQRDQLVVRLPDEVPHAAPIVRLILDTELASVNQLTCRGSDELLDALVRVWLGVGKTLVQAGSRVVLVSAGERRGLACPVERQMTARGSSEALRLGARATWQSTLALGRMLDPTVGRQIVVSCRPRPIASAPAVTWLVVPEVAWTGCEPDWPTRNATKLMYPSGSAENRAENQRREMYRINEMWHDRTLFSQLVCWIDWKKLSGGFVARPVQGRVLLQVIP